MLKPSVVAVYNKTYKQLRAMPINRLNSSHRRHWLYEELKATRQKSRHSE
jgi:hypothetical protein